MDITGNGNYPSNDGVYVTEDRTLIVGDPDGATVQLQIYSVSMGDWIDVTDGSFTESSVKVVSAGGKQKYRLNVSGFSSAFKIDFQ